jgi:hypothetical protein
LRLVGCVSGLPSWKRSALFGITPANRRSLILVGPVGLRIPRTTPIPERRRPISSDSFLLESGTVFRSHTLQPSPAGLHSLTRSSPATTDINQENSPIMIGIFVYPAVTTQIQAKYLTCNCVSVIWLAGIPKSNAQPSRPIQKTEAAGRPLVCFQSEKEVKRSMNTSATA